LLDLLCNRALHEYGERNSKFSNEETTMNRFIQVVAISTVLVSLTACSTWEGLSKSEKGAVIGAGVGGVAGAAASDGGVLGTVGGAAVGGVVGNQVGKHQEKKDDKQ
jgi:osmotically inducible lipoprotein OsmB